MTKIIFAALMAFSFGAFAAEGDTTPPATDGATTDAGMPAEKTAKDKKKMAEKKDAKGKKKQHAH